MRATVSVGLLIIMAVFASITCFAGERLPLRVQLVLVKVSSLMEKGTYDEAAAILNEFRSRADKGGVDVHEHPQVNFTLGNCRYRQGQFQEAAAAYKRVVQREPGHQDAWQNLASVEYELGHHVEASRCFLRAYELSEKTKGELLYYGAVTMLMAEQHKRSIELFEQLFTSHPEQVQLSWKENLVYALLAVDRNKRALPYIKELAEEYEGKKKRQWCEILLQQYMALAMYAEARQFAIELTRLEPNEPLWWKTLAHVYLQKNQLEQALNALTIYRFLTPLTFEEKKLVADLHLQLGIPVKAVDDYEACINAEPDEEILKRLVHAYMELGRMETALKRLQQFGKGGESRELSMLKGDILYGLKQFREAITIFENAAGLTEDADAGRAWLMVGYSQWQLQDTGKSILAFKRAARSERYKREATQAIEQLEEALQLQIIAAEADQSV